MYTYDDFQAGKPLPKGWDGADAVADGWTSQQIEAFMRATVQPWTPASAQERAAGGAAGEATGHPDIAAMMRRIERLTRVGSLTEGERGILAGALEALAAMGRECGRELAGLEGKPLHDPGCRPEARAVFYYRLTHGRGFDLVLGYFHRVREYVERLEAKHGGAGGASR